MYVYYVYVYAYIYNNDNNIYILIKYVYMYIDKNTKNKHLSPPCGFILPCSSSIVYPRKFLVFPFPSFFYPSQTIKCR